MHERLQKILNIFIFITNSSSTTVNWGATKLCEFISKTAFLITVIITSFFNNTALFAAPVDMQFAEKAAGNFLKADTQGQKQSHDEYMEKIKENEIINFFSPQSKIINVVPLNNDYDEPAAYVCELSPSGYIVLSADTDIEPILAYSHSGKFPFIQSDPSASSKPQSNPFIDLILWDMENRITAVHQQLISYEIIDNNNKEWDDISNEVYPRTKENRADPVYFIETSWHQTDPYNKFCPMDFNWVNERSVAGCLAVAMAQILGYWEYPASVSLSDSIDTYITESSKINIDDDYAEYDFLSFPQLNSHLSSISYSSTDDIAALIFACGIFVKMDYTEDDGSNADMMDAPDVFINKFKYTSANFTTYNTNSLLSEMTVNKIPAIIRIATSSSLNGGHAINVDGYDSTNKKYHLNFGWGSTSPSDIAKTWYSLPSGLPSGYNVVTHMVTNITPKPNAPSNLTATALSSSSIKLSWTDKSNNETGFYVYRWNGSAWVKITTLGANTTTYTDSNLSASTTYHYSVYSYNSAGASRFNGNSNGYISATTQQTTMGESNLTPYKPSGWSDKIVVSNTTGTTTDKSPLYSTDTIYVDWVVINNGTSSVSTKFYTKLYVDGVEKASWYTNSLSANFWCYVKDCSIGKLEAGTHTIKIKTDSTGVISESNENDNAYSKVITVE